MNIITYAESSYELGLCKEAQINEVIVSDKRFSRFANNTDVNELLSQAKELELKTIFEWDTLVTEKDFEKNISDFQTIRLDLVDSIRVQDPGVLEYILTETKLPIQYICETGNHNLMGLKTWESYIGDRLERLVLSIELSKEILGNYKKNLKTPIETLAMGPILLFYSPRYLLSPLAVDEMPVEVKALADSEESPHKGFPIVQNAHGTFMFHIKNLFLLDRYQDLKDTGLDCFRVDLRDLDAKDIIKKFHPDEFLLNLENLKQEYPKDVIRGYFQINKSDVLFKKLKNYRIQRKDADYIGEVVETGKPDYMAIKILTDTKVKVGETLKMVNPEGKIYQTEVVFLKNIKNEDITEAGLNDLVLMNYRGGVWPKSQLYKSNLS